MVWVSFVAAMTLVMGAFSFQGGSRGGFLATNLQTLEKRSSADAAGKSRVFQIDAPLHEWSGIVIHHLGEPAGDPQSVHRQHVAWGYQGLGYHFLIGNGNGFGDGVVHAGYRWLEQLPGAHVAGKAGAEHNANSIGICLIGNGDRRTFTDRQIDMLFTLVEQLRVELAIPADRVYLHRDLSDGTTSPGSFFPAARMREHLRTLSR